jgi:peptidyl-prolyl cis-trans isomerase D
MSVIQKIRDKYARIAVVMIALALLGFILMDAFTGRSKLFGGNSSTLGRVNGKAIDYVDFEKKVKVQEEAQQQQQGYHPDEASRQQLIQSLWDQEVNQTIMNEQFDKLGLTIGKKELNDILFGQNPPQDLKQRFTDPSTGMYNAAQAQQLINQIKKSKNQTEINQLELYLSSLEMNRMMEKYNSLLVNSINFPRWFLEKQNSDNSLLAKVSFVSYPYSKIPDSTIKVSDKEIADYISQHKKDFKQKETRNIAYVLFSAAPTTADTNAVRQKLSSLNADFDSTKDYETFLKREGSKLPFYDAYVSKGRIQNPHKDSILKTPAGGIYGPYLDENNLVLAKIVGIKQWPDTAKVRHILIATQKQNEAGQMVRVKDDSTAKHLADSILNAIKGGASFDTLVVRYSDDPGSKDKGGVYDSIPTGKMVPTFNDFIFDHKTGEKGIVHTEFGYHVIEILGQKGSQPAYKIAYLARPITASEETDQSASNNASLFAGDSRDVKSFDANFEKTLKPKGYNKLIALDIQPNDYEVQGIGSSRQLIRAIYNANKGDVLQPYRVGENYIVVAVTDVNHEGTSSVSSARSSVEPILRNKKKAEQTKQKLGKITTLEAASSAIGQPTQTADSLRFNGASNPALGFEFKVVGAAFNPANKGKVVPEAIEGQAGVYVLRVDNITTTPVATANIEEQRKVLQAQARQSMMYRNNPTEVLKKSANIKDDRAKFY